MSTPNQTPSTQEPGSSTTPQGTTTTNPPANNDTPPTPPAENTLSLTQSELDKMISKGIETATGKFNKQISDYESRIKGLEQQNMTTEELAVQKQKEVQEASAAKIAELSETNQRLQIKAKIAETGLPLDESLFVNTNLEIDDIFKNIDNMAQKYNDDLEKALATKQSKAATGVASQSVKGSQVTSNRPKYTESTPWV